MTWRRQLIISECITIKQINIEKYAASKNISVSWFIQNFKQYTNTTPAQYIQNLRLSNAKSLLETTNYNVTEISNLLDMKIHYISAAFFRETVWRFAVTVSETTAAK